MIRRVVAGLRDTMRLLSPAVRADRAYTIGRRRLIDEAAALALAGRPWLPGPRFGEGYDERVVEYPWMLARLGTGDALLDAGSTLNNEQLLPLAARRYQRIIF